MSTKADVQSVAERFWSKVDRRGPHECWPWTGYLNPKGYGQFTLNGRSRKAHAVAFELTYGPIPEGLEPDHRCHSDDPSCRGGDGCPHRACQNPGHLDAVTHRENSRRAKYRIGTCPEGHQMPAPGPRGRRVCRECANRRNREYKARQRELRPPTPKELPPHGRGRYTHHGCRCEVCCEAENSYKREWRRKRSPLRLYEAITGGSGG